MVKPAVEVKKSEDGIRIVVELEGHTKTWGILPNGNLSPTSYSRRTPRTIEQRMFKAAVKRSRDIKSRRAEARGHELKNPDNWEH